MPMDHYYRKKMLAWLLPYTCILCHQPSQHEQDLCNRCYQTLPLIKSACQHCAIPLPETTSTLVCGQCLQQVPPFDLTYALYLYQFPVNQIILDLKFNQSLINARVLGELLTEKIQHTWYSQRPLPDIIIPVPLHPVRLKERGFNQALEIARPIAQSLKLPINREACQRTKPTAAQATLSPAERRKNIKQAFTVTQDFTQQRIAVIDDVITTGHTVTELCQTLKRHGAQAIDVWCCARATLMHI
jgi:ComF family protein